MIAFITSTGVEIDLLPNQEIALTIENAFLSSDRIPVAWTTDIELALSEKNRKLFGIPGAMLLAPQKKQLNVEMRIDGITVMSGKLKLTGCDSQRINASFVGVEIESSLTGSLKDIPLDKWNFGKLGEYDDKTLYNEVMTGAADGTRDDFATPCMIRASEEDTEEPYIDLPTESTREAWATKFLNAKIGTFTVPVVRLKYLLQRICADYRIDEEFATYIDKIGIVAPYRTNGNIADYRTGCLDKDENGNFILDLASGMPDVSIEDFVKNLLNVFAATIYLTPTEKRIVANKTIIEDAEFIDWTNRIGDDFEQECEEEQHYECGFSGVSETEIKESVVECEHVNEAFKQPEDTVVHASDTGDYYRVFKKTVSLGLSYGESTKKDVTALKLLKQGGMAMKSTSAGDANETISATSNFIPVRSLPYLMPAYVSWAINTEECVVIPIIEMPEVGGTRPTNVYFGTLENLLSISSSYAPEVQLTSNGCYGTGGGLVSLFTTSETALSMNGALYGFHEPYKNWIEKEKTVTKISVNLTVADLANLQIWKKRMIYNQLFFIKTLAITCYTSKNGITAEADFISA